MANPPLTSVELNAYLDNLELESLQSVKSVSKEWDDHLKYYKHKQWPERIPSHRQMFTANLCKLTVARKTAIITDIKPTIEVKAQAHGLEELAEQVVTPVMRANWDEQGYGQKLANGIIPMAMVFGCCPVNVCYDPSLDNGRGDMTIEPIDPRSFFLDPAVVRAVDIDRAEYAGFKTVKSLREIRTLFPDRGHLVAADSTLSRFLESQPRVSTLESPVQSALRTAAFGRQGAGGTPVSYAIDRAGIEEFLLQDSRVIGELPRELQERAFAQGRTLNDLAWPGGRRVVRAGPNKVILFDGPNPYIDNKIPYEMFDWGVEFEHPWGESELAMIKSLQNIVNKLGAAIVENAIKMNNMIWVGDKDALLPHEWNQLSDAPGLQVKVKPQRVLRREGPPALPSSVFQLMQFCINLIDTLTGLVDVTQGRRPVGIVSAHAVEALTMAAQTLIRLQAYKLEKFIERIGQKLVARFFQFYTTDRVKYLLGPGEQLMAYHFERKRLFDAQLVESGPEGATERPFEPTRDFADLRFKVMQGSSLASTRIQRAQVAGMLHQGGIVPAVDVLRALDWPDPEGTVQKARQENMAAGLLAGTAGQRGKGPRPRLAA
jgi:hypothetical protein